MRSQWLSEFSLSSKDEQRLEKFYQDIDKESAFFLGYPCNCIFDYSPLYRFLQYPLNNVGDPYILTIPLTKSYAVSILTAL